MKKNCLFCDSEFVKRVRGGKPQVYCSPSCCRKHWRQGNGKEKNSLIQKRNYLKNRLNPHRRFYEIKLQAEIRKHPFSLSTEQFMILWNKSCHYCGEKIDGIGIDRIDNSKGYSLENCVPCCIDCNKMKMTKTIEQFFRKCEIIVSRVRTYDTKAIR